MAKIKRGKGEKNKQNPNNLPSIVPKKEISQNPEYSPNVGKQENKERIETLVIPEKTIIIQPEKHATGMFIAQIIIAAVTVVSVWVVYNMTSRQTEIAQDTLSWQRDRDSVNAIKDSIKTAQQNRKDSITIAIAETSAAINIRSMLSAERATKIQTSPYISPHIRVTEKPEIGKDFAFEIDFTNNGQTPAFNFSVGGKTQFGTMDYIGYSDSVPVTIERKNTILPPSIRTTVYERIDRSEIDSNFINNIRKNIWKLRTIVEFEYKTRWGDVEKFRFTEYYVFNRNSFMRITEHR